GEGPHGSLRVGRPEPVIDAAAPFAGVLLLPLGHPRSLLRGPPRVEDRLRRALLHRGPKRKATLMPKTTAPARTARLSSGQRGCISNTAARFRRCTQYSHGQPISRPRWARAPAVGSGPCPPGLHRGSYPGACGRRCACRPRARPFGSARSAPARSGSSGAWVLLLCGPSLASSLVYWLGSNTQSLLSFRSSGSNS